MPNGDKCGFVVVVDNNNHFLSRSLTVVKHKNRNRGSTGAQRAWVHCAEVVLKGGVWATAETLVIPAHYDERTDLTVITGEPMTLEQFREAQKVAA